MISLEELEQELGTIQALNPSIPLWFDVKGRQLRVTEVSALSDHMEIEINHPIRVKTPTKVLFKAGLDYANLVAVEEGGRRLVFDEEGANYAIRPGESLHIKDPSFQATGEQFTQLEVKKICRVKQAGFKRFFLSYVQSQLDVDEFLDWVGEDSQVMLKIEDKKGLEYVAREFHKRDNLTLVAARGDLFIEVDKPTDILSAHLLILEKDPQALVGSRLLLSTVGAPAPELQRLLTFLEGGRLADEVTRGIILSLLSQPIPSCSDLLEMAWLYDIGYRKMMLCDELCLKDELLSSAVDAFDQFRQSYGASA